MVVCVSHGSGAPTLAVFISAIKEWVKSQTLHFNQQERKKLGHELNPKTHLETVEHVSSYAVGSKTNATAYSTTSNNPESDHPQQPPCLPSHCHAKIADEATPASLHPPSD
ncbi:hypothetical protein CROQUDRAFT_88443 [Cronartium quercuum f. sp. fusiforme G11]|uniref:Uncharacterized protein n=1 Tax=Cronartium quercuum f. sp. fusiforme G11 TaxID=708437 RepID=A0A9P6NR56_9BASI|nr:hypothetical protein CROQUDRAFT_88443 [Cronartium quercuum f. sp. fusiforme G11]